MGELLLRKILACRERIAKLGSVIPTPAEAILADERLESFLSFQLFLLIQDAVDLAAHVVAERGLAVPASQRESFEALARAGVLTAKSSAAMARLASLRNRIAHSYGDLDVVRMVRELPAGLTDARQFLDELVLSTSKTE
jgi:uncharacterized protein YutE (UPF0331/DUF86 family)